MCQAEWGNCIKMVHTHKCQDHRGVSLISPLAHLHRNERGNTPSSSYINTMQFTMFLTHQVDIYNYLFASVESRHEIKWPCLEWLLCCVPGVFAGDEQMPSSQFHFWSQLIRDEGCISHPEIFWMLRCGQWTSSINDRIISEHLFGFLEYIPKRDMT